MIVFPNSKINLGLRILRKRSDGYHDLETIFYPIPLTDVLEIITTDIPDKPGHVDFSKSGFAIDGNPDDNLCVKAYKLLHKDFLQIPTIKMHLHKAVPTGAGLGGGSADAAFTLRWLNEKFTLGLDTEQLINYALQLGSDCPFFIINKACCATGRGEKLEPIDLDLAGYKIIVVNPGIHINTGQAFLQIKPCEVQHSVKDIIIQPIESWKDELVNDFEQWVFKENKEIENIKDELYQQGALFAAMSGSGSTVFGIFKKDSSLQFNFPKKYFVRELNI